MASTSDYECHEDFSAIASDSSDDDKCHSDFGFNSDDKYDFDPSVWFGFDEDQGEEQLSCKRQRRGQRHGHRDPPVTVHSSKTQAQRPATMDFINEISSSIVTTCNRNNHIALNAYTHMFMRDCVLDVSIRDFLKRCVRHLKLYDTELIYAVMLLSQIDSRTKEKVHHLNVCNIISATILVSCKFLRDEVWDNKYFAEVFSLTLSEINRFEVLLVKTLAYDIYYTEHQMGCFVRQLLKGRSCGQLQELHDELLEL